MGKRKAPSNSPYDVFLQTSWEKNDKKGDYSVFVKTCEVKWREMTDTEKEEYIKKDEVGLEDGASSNRKPRKVSKKEKDPNKPKRPRTSYLFFCNAFRDEVKSSNPWMTMTDVTKELSLRWNALSSFDKQKYIDMANEEKKKYQEILNQEGK